MIKANNISENAQPNLKSNHCQTPDEKAARRNVHNLAAGVKKKTWPCLKRIL